MFCSSIIILEPPIKLTLNKGHLSIKEKKLFVPIPICIVHFNLQIKRTRLLVQTCSLFGSSTVYNIYGAQCIHLVTTKAS